MMPSLSARSTGLILKSFALKRASLPAAAYVLPFSAIWKSSVASPVCVRLMLKYDTSKSVASANSRLPWMNHAMSSLGAVYVPVTVSSLGPNVCEITSRELPASVLYCDLVPQSLQLIVSLNLPFADFDFALIVTVYDPPGAAAGVVPTANMRYGGPPCPSWQ